MTVIASLAPEVTPVETHSESGVHNLNDSLDMHVQRSHPFIGFGRCNDELKRARTQRAKSTGSSNR
ncbi:hypothetical protein IG631_09873 [Alternaria alternata]|nr:hypothetical protein IG631_09873 [Alternaria alternata]